MEGFDGEEEEEALEKKRFRLEDLHQGAALGQKFFVTNHDVITSYCHVFCREAVRR